MPQRTEYLQRQTVDSAISRWDWALLPLVLALLALLAYGASQMTRPFQVGDPLPVTLDVWQLPYYLLRTTLRMFLALAGSLVFAAVFAVLAAKYRAAERVLVPMLDILQSIPILGFLSITVAGFIALLPGNLFGVECAAIFAVLMSQAWNMAFSLYQSLRTVPAMARRWSVWATWRRSIRRICRPPAPASPTSPSASRISRTGCMCRCRGFRVRYWPSTPKPICNLLPAPLPPVVRVGERGLVIGQA